MKSLLGKVVWVTGASSGIGEALVYALAQKGAKIILSARRKEVLEKVRGNCPLQSQSNIHVLPLDLSDTGSLPGKAMLALGIFGHIDILVNNGGISQRGLAKETVLDVDRRLMEVNYFGAVALTKAVLPHFLARKEGHLVAITSLTGRFGTPYRSGYAASKHALHGFFDSLRAELWKDVGGNIPVTLVCPGFIRTALTLTALTGDGSPLNKMDEAQYKGRPADWCARKIVEAIGHEREEVYIGGREVAGIYLKRFFPRLFSRIIRTAKVR